MSDRGSNGSEDDGSCWSNIKRFVKKWTGKLAVATLGLVGAFLPIVYYACARKEMRHPNESHMSWTEASVVALIGLPFVLQYIVQCLPAVRDCFSQRAKHHGPDGETGESAGGDSTVEMVSNKRAGRGAERTSNANDESDQDERMDTSLLHDVDNSLDKDPPLHLVLLQCLVMFLGFAGPVVREITGKGAPFGGSPVQHGFIALVIICSYYYGGFVRVGMALPAFQSLPQDEDLDAMKRKTDWLVKAKFVRTGISSPPGNHSDVGANGSESLVTDKNHAGFDAKQNDAHDGVSAPKAPCTSEYVVLELFFDAPGQCPAGIRRFGTDDKVYADACLMWWSQSMEELVRDMNAKDKMRARAWFLNEAATAAVLTFITVLHLAFPHSSSTSVASWLLVYYTGVFTIHCAYQLFSVYRVQKSIDSNISTFCSAMHRMHEPERYSPHLSELANRIDKCDESDGGPSLDGISIVFANDYETIRRSWEAHREGGGTNLKMNFGQTPVAVNSTRIVSAIATQVTSWLLALAQQLWTAAKERSAAEYYTMVGAAVLLAVVGLLVCACWSTVRATDYDQLSTDADHWQPAPRTDGVRRDGGTKRLESV